MLSCHFYCFIVLHSICRWPYSLKKALSFFCGFWHWSYIISEDEDEEDEDDEDDEKDEEDDESEESESEDRKTEKEDIGDLERTIQDIQNVKLSDSQETKHKPDGDTVLVCYRFL